MEPGRLREVEYATQLLGFSTDAFTAAVASDAVDIVTNNLQVVYKANIIAYHELTVNMYIFRV